MGFQQVLLVYSVVLNCRRTSEKLGAGVRHILTLLTTVQYRGLASAPKLPRAFP